MGIQVGVHAQQRREGDVGILGLSQDLLSAALPRLRSQSFSACSPCIGDLASPKTPNRHRPKESLKISRSPKQGDPINPYDLFEKIVLAPSLLWLRLPSPVGEGLQLWEESPKSIKAISAQSLGSRVCSPLQPTCREVVAYSLRACHYNTKSKALSGDLTNEIEGFKVQDVLIRKARTSYASSASASVAQPWKGRMGQKTHRRYAEHGASPGA